jgi:hypothetical protein
MTSDGDNDLLPGIEVEGVEGCYLCTYGAWGIAVLPSYERASASETSNLEPSDEPGRRPAVSYRTTSNHFEARGFERGTSASLHEAFEASISDR